MARTSLLNKTTDENLEALCRLLDELYAYRIIQEHVLDQVEAILFELHGPDDTSYEDSDETSISQLYEYTDDRIIFIQDLRNTIRYAITHNNFNLNDAIFDTVDLRDI